MSRAPQRRHSIRPGSHTPVQVVVIVLLWRTVFVAALLAPAYLAVLKGESLSSTASSLALLVTAVAAASLSLTRTGLPTAFRQ
jgi:hypothetical protein